MSLWNLLPSNRLLVEASLWSADFTRFGDEIARIDDFADLYHIDVSDGHFVPGLLFFADFVKALRPLTRKPFHVHLMTDNPLLHIQDFIDAGADLITIQAENGPLAPAALETIRRAGAAAGIALGLDVPPERIESLFEWIDLILLMGTPMGVKGVEPSPIAYERITRMRQLLRENDWEDRIKIAADGGIRQHTAAELRTRGADIIVAGSLVFKSPDLDETFDWLHTL